jgi:outer membrane protein OmpA-like peptidoglycan-associated protein
MEARGRFGRNGNMKIIWLFVGLVALCGCPGGRVRDGVDHRPPLPPSDPGPRAEPVKESLPPIVPKDVTSSKKAEVTPPAETLPRRTIEAAVSEVNGQLQDIYFAYDRFELSPEAMSALRHDAELLAAIAREFGDVEIFVEGHCDERGSAEYNLGLGERRASRALDVLAEFSVPLARMNTISYGKERPQCGEADEGCWRLNRRAHVRVGRDSPAESRLQP